MELLFMMHIMSGEFDNGEWFDSPLDGLVDTVCSILERNHDAYNVPEFNSMEAENRWFRKVRILVANAINFGELVLKLQSNLKNNF